MLVFDFSFLFCICFSIGISLLLSFYIYLVVISFHSRQSLSKDAGSQPLLSRNLIRLNERLNRYGDSVIIRFLRTEERVISMRSDSEFPFVIEALINMDSKQFHQFLSTYSIELVEDLNYFGAILLRGFNVKSSSEFEEAILSIKGMNPINQNFMSAPGRDIVDNTKYIFHPNTINLPDNKSKFELFFYHNENYFHADVCEYIHFCCLKSPRFGGETGLCHFGNVYNELPIALQAKLDKSAFKVSNYNIADIAKRYRISESEAYEICKTIFEIQKNSNGSHYITIFKPTVLEHPITKKPALSVNFVAFGNTSLRSKINDEFINDYIGLEWIIHRARWRFKYSERMIYFKQIITKLNPIAIIKSCYNLRNNRSNPPAENIQRTVRDVFDQNDFSYLAKAVRKNHSSCKWQSGDIMLVDNKQIAHNGMPGFGTRVIRTMMCNPIQLNLQFGSTAAGRQVPVPSNSLVGQLFERNSSMRTTN